MTRFSSFAMLALIGALVHPTHTVPLTISAADDDAVSGMNKILAEVYELKAEVTALKSEKAANTMDPNEHALGIAKKGQANAQTVKTQNFDWTFGLCNSLHGQIDEMRGTVDKIDEMSGKVDKMYNFLNLKPSLLADYLVSPPADASWVSLLLHSLYTWNDWNNE